MFKEACRYDDPYLKQPYIDLGYILHVYMYIYNIEILGMGLGTRLRQ